MKTTGPVVHTEQTWQLCVTFAQRNADVSSALTPLNDIFDLYTTGKGILISSFFRGANVPVNTATHALTCPSHSTPPLF